MLVSESSAMHQLRRRSAQTPQLDLIADRMPLEHCAAWPYLKEVELSDSNLVWSWDRKKLRSAWLHQGTYLLRTNLTDRDPKKLWRQYIQLTEIEAVFRTLKTELNLRPIFHRIQRRVEAHILIAFLGYWVIAYGSV